MTLIDLDQPAPEPKAALRAPSRGRRIAGTVALMLVAAGLGGLATSRWQQESSRSAVQVVVLAHLSPSPPGLDEIPEDPASADRTGKVTVAIHLAVVNTGPAPVRMASVNIAAFGMSADTWMPMDKLIASGQGTINTIIGDLDCGASPLPWSAPATVELITADGTHRQRVPATADAAAWTIETTQTCQK